MDDQLQRAMLRQLRDLPQRFVATRIAEKLKEQKIDLSERDVQRLTRKLLERKSETVTLWTWKWWERRSAHLNFTDGDAAAIKKDMEDFVENKLPELLNRTIDEATDALLVRLKKDWSSERRRQRRDVESFRRRLYERWGPAVDLLAMLVTMTREVGGTINDRLRRKTSAPDATVADVLTRLHARSCQVAEEIICLLRAGYADGAMARWRTLHEIAVVTLFIDQHGNDTAVRYVEHQFVESHFAAEEYQRCATRLGYPALGQSELDRIRADFDAAVAKYGKPFASPYGWAATALGTKRPTFADIEKSIGIDHLRSHYRMSSHHVHANPRGVFFKLGLISEIDVLLSGPSNAGLADPGHATAISLLQIVAPLVMKRPTMDNVISLKIMAKLEDEIGAAFIDAHDKLVADST